MVIFYFSHSFCSRNWTLNCKEQLLFVPHIGMDSWIFILSYRLESIPLIILLFGFGLLGAPLDWLLSFRHGSVSLWGFLHGSVGKESACNAGDSGSIPGSETSTGEGNGNPLQCSCLENPVDRGAWWATVRGVARVRHDWMTKPPPAPSVCEYSSTSWHHETFRFRSTELAVSKAPWFPFSWEQLVEIKVWLVSVPTATGQRSLVGSSPWGRRVRHNWVTSLTSYFNHWRRTWQPTPVFLPGESHGQRNPAGHGPRGRRESDTTEVTEHALLLECYCF